MLNRLLILAAGMSSRMKADTAQTLSQELTNQANTLPKCMIGLGKSGRPFLDYLLCNAAKGGINEVLLLLNPADKYTLAYYKKQMADSQNFGIKILYAIQHIPTGYQKPLGTSDAILQALSQHSNWRESRFIVCNSDNIYPSTVFEILSETGRQRMIAFDAEGYEQARVRNCAIVEADDAGFLIDLIEKPTDDEWQNIRNTMPRIGISWNVFGLNPDEIIPFLENTPLHPIRNEKELPVSIRMMVKANPKSMEVVCLPNVIPDLTNKSDIAGIQRFLTENFEF